jgi:hypothetical protein
MTGYEHEAQQVVADVIIAAFDHPGDEIRHGHLLRLELASELLMFALEKLTTAEQVDRTIFAAATSQAPGLSGTPDSGHCWSAATRASCARSSARPTSRTIRASPAMSLADSILQTAPIVRCVSVAVMATDDTIFKP